MTTKDDNNRALAFAGILQALQLVQSTAYGKPYDLGAFQSTLSSILFIDAATVEDVYGDPSHATGKWELVGAVSPASNAA